MLDLSRLPGREYTDEVKKRLRNDEAWKAMCAPEIMERTRWALQTMHDSLVSQIERIGPEDKRWYDNAAALLKHVKYRLNALPTNDGPIVSGNSEAKNWRTFAALLAVALRDGDRDALHRLHAPYGGLSAAQWLEAREESAA